MDTASRREGSGPVVVAIGTGAEGAALVAEAKAIARKGDRGLSCITIDSGGSLSAEASANIAQAHELARAEGAAVARAPGIDVAEAIRRYAEAQDASTVVVGCRARALSRKAIASRLIAARRGFAVVALSPRTGEIGPGPRERRFPMSGSGAHYAAALLMVACATAVNLALASYAGYWAAAILYLAAISLGAIWLESGPILFAAVLSALAWDFLFIPPRFTLNISRPEDDLMLALYLLVSVCSGLMTSRLRSSERLLRAQEAKISGINALALRLAGASSTSVMLDIGIRAIEEAISCEAIVILKQDELGLKTQAESGWEPLDADARSAAQRCFEGGALTGRYTSILPSSEWHFIALESPKGRLGVIGVRTTHDADWDESDESYLQTIDSTIAIALAREM
jgi:two-component system, OmpR family, sensor histidine kinase KdpD